MLQEEGFIRGYAEVEFKGHKELEIELKYHEGEPVIRELKRVSTPGPPRLFLGAANSSRIARVWACPSSPRRRA